MLDWWYEQNRINGQIRELRELITELSKKFNDRLSKLEKPRDQELHYSSDLPPLSSIALSKKIYESAFSEEELDKMDKVFDRSCSLATDLNSSFDNFSHFDNEKTGTKKSSMYGFFKTDALLDKEEAEERDEFIKKIGLINNIPYDELYALAEKHGY